MECVQGYDEGYREERKKQGYYTLNPNELEPGKGYYGLSLSGCVSDIADGRLLEQQVVGLITGTCASNEEEFKAVIESYKLSYWSDDPQAAEALAWRFWEKGLIEQPRLQNAHYDRGWKRWLGIFLGKTINYGPHISWGRWIEVGNVDKIIYAKSRIT